jgi:hypothetical protein
MITSSQAPSINLDGLQAAVKRACDFIDTLQEQKVALREALNDVRDLIEGYQDVSDGDYGVPVANKAMRAVQRIDEALGR